MGRRRRHGSSNKDEPFVYLTFKVGCCVLCMGWLVSHVTLLLSFPRSRWTGHSPHSIVSQMGTRDGRYIAGDATGGTQLPVFDLDPRSAKHDAFGIHDELAKSGDVGIESASLSEFYDEVSRLKKEFASLYGGENKARYLINAGVTTFHPSASMDDNDHIFDAYDMQNIPSGLKHTAHRLLAARQQNRSFKVAFGGYSVTVGRGNYFEQSYPFVLQRLLERPMKLLGIELNVRNAAIGGVPSFPYGWCLNNFLGDDADVISWDYSMNEAGGVADGLEAYIRHGLSMRRRPMLVVKDTSTSIAQERYDLLQSYVNSGGLKDPIALGIEDVIGSFLSVKEELLPSGFREWRKFGAPKGAPGQTSHHPGIKEHELYGWLLTMHFIAVLELVAFFVSSGERSHGLLAMWENESTLEHRSLPPPIHGKHLAPKEVHSLFYGHGTANTQNSNLMTWKMNQVHCRTTYDPILSGNLQDIVVSGSGGEDLDIMLPRGLQLYNGGWVLDLGGKEKTAKKKLERYGGLGYVDSKKAYYGIKASGPLELFLPCTGHSDVSQNSIAARQCFGNVVVCEVNEKHEGKECNLNEDLSFLVGGIASEKILPVTATGASYWGRNICIRIGIPENAVLSNQGNKFGLSLIISVASKSVLLRSGPCSVSHVVWEETK